MRQVGWRAGVKRALDVAVAGAALVVSAPALAAAAVAIRTTMGAPVVFRQTRPGIHGRPFTVIKLRTMREAIGADGRPLPDAERLTAVGQFVRSASLDELPQMLNVLRGEMSIVGPRPLLMQYVDRYTREQMRRHDVKPGLTGWAQVNGRNTTSWEERFALDVWYVDHWSLALDVEIIARTFVALVRREGISQEGQATMTEFMGAAPVVQA